MRKEGEREREEEEWRERWGKGERGIEKKNRDRKYNLSNKHTNTQKKHTNHTTL